MSLNELDDMYYEYCNLSDARKRFINSIDSFFNRLKQERGYLIDEIEKSDEHISFKFMGHHIRIQHEISLTKQHSHVKWVNIKYDYNNKIEDECLLDYHIDKSGVIKIGEQNYDLSIKVNKFLIDGLLNFFKILEEKNE